MFFLSLLFLHARVINVRDLDLTGGNYEYSYRAGNSNRWTKAIASLDLNKEEWTTTQHQFWKYCLLSKLLTFMFYNDDFVWRYFARNITSIKTNLNNVKRYRVYWLFIEPSLSSNERHFPTKENAKIQRIAIYIKEMKIRGKLPSII